jgi:hypothetical protein
MNPEPGVSIHNIASGQEKTHADKKGCETWLDPVWL